MESSIKKFSFIIVVVFIIICVFVLISINSEDQTPSTGSAIDKINANITQEIKLNLSDRNIVISEALEHPEKLQKTKIKGETYFITGYNETHYLDNSHDNKPGRKFGGILIFKLSDNKPVLFWESEEYISKPYVSFRDIDNDGTDEIVWDGDIGVTGRNNALYVYKYINNGFQLITPVNIVEGINAEGVTIKTSTTILSGDSDLTYMKDIDNDKIQEIIVGYRDENDKIVSKIYKYNGSNYFLWKEVPVVK